MRDYKGKSENLEKSRSNQKEEVAMTINFKNGEVKLTFKIGNATVEIKIKF